MFACNGIVPKCEMRHLVVRIEQERKKKGSKSLGQLGPCQFQDMEAFLIAQPKRGKVTTTIPNSVPSVVAIGDIHGDLLALLGQLRMHALVDLEGNWTGQKRWFVTTGDWIDRAGRGEDEEATSKNPREEIDIIQYMFALNLQAQKDGGGVVMMIGNHEFMRVGGDDETVLSYGGLNVDGWGGLPRLQTMWARGGPMALFMAKHCPIVVVWRHLLFVHGSVPLSLALKYKDKLPSSLNTKWKTFLKGNKDVPDIDDVLEVLEDRTMGEGPCPPDLDQILGLLDVETVVIGHTVQSPDKSPCVCNGKIVRLDFAMSEGFGQTSFIKSAEFSSKGAVLVRTSFGSSTSAGQSDVLYVKGFPISTSGELFSIAQ